MNLKQITDRILQVMEERGVSQRALAVQLGLSPSTLNKMLRGSGNLQMNTLIAIAQELRVEPMALLAPDEEWLAVWESFSGLSHERRQTAVAVLHDLAAAETAEKYQRRAS